MQKKASSIIEEQRLIGRAWRVAEALEYGMIGVNEDGGLEG